MGLPVDPFPGEQQFNLWKLLKKKKIKSVYKLSQAQTGNKETFI